MGVRAFYPGVDPVDLLRDGKGRDAYCRNERGPASHQRLGRVAVSRP